MGVRGLTTYINYNQDVFMQQYYLYDTNLVIDGHSLCAQLYRLLNCFSAFGGDYDKFASYVKTFFKNLRKCNVTPYVIFDGCYESRKLRTVFNRLRSKLNGASRLDPVTQDSLQIFPFLLRDVFREVLAEIKVSYTICEFEADDEIASLARHLNCPVLSYDSDFFIYNVLYVPFNTLQIKPKPMEFNGKKHFVMECKMYKVQYLCEHFGGLKEELLPLLATLLGNDFVEKTTFRQFFSQLKLQKSRNQKNEQQRTIHALFNWLQNETLDSAIAKILGRLKKNHKEKVFAIIKKSVSGYNSEYCKSLKYFNITKEESPQEDELKMPNVEESSESDNNNEEDLARSSDEEGTQDEDEDEENNEQIDCVPDWFAEKVRQNLIPTTYLNLYLHHIQICNPQAEDFSDKDAFLCTLSILRYAFDILTDFSEEHCVYVSREQNCNYQKLLVDREGSVPRLLDVPFNELSKEQLNLYFNHFLNEKLPNLDMNLIQQLPSNFQLFMISVLWWISNCSVPAAHVYSLILSYLTLDVIDEKTGTYRSHYLFNNKYSKKLEELTSKADPITSLDNEVLLNKNKIEYDDCLIAASVLIKHFEIDSSIIKRPKSYDIKKIHSFAQFQCILHQMNSLNILCGSPFQSTIYYKCYNGTFIYNIALKLEKQNDPLNFIEQYIKGAKSVLMFYRNICSLYKQLLEKMSLSTVKWSCKRKKNRRKKNDVDDEISFIVKGFESDVKI